MRLLVDHAMFEIYSTVHRHLKHKLNSQNSTLETTHLKQLAPNTFVVDANFKPLITLQIFWLIQNFQHVSDVK